MRYIVRTISWNKERLNNCNTLKKDIPNLEIDISDDTNAYSHFIDICKKINDTGAVILEDDVQLCRDFTYRIESIIDEKGIDKVYNFFEKPKTYFKSKYHGGGQFLWMQCIYLPPRLPNLIAGYYTEFQKNEPQMWTGNATDRLIGYALKKEKLKYWSIRPCLVQHLPFKSAIGSRPTNRQSPYFIDYLEEMGVVYDELESTD